MVQMIQLELSISSKLPKKKARTIATVTSTN
jgi:hypothetical protein